ncbi:UDP-N-acetylglucosamine 2-epimerase [bacterium BMS3Abin04]|nr:UDP-N-acetylglucosamine 2-epimerase [bacterium BMS3Abin04]
MKKLSFIFGTRPEAIKLAPLILEFKKNSNFEINVCVTAQHREMLDQVLEIFEIVPDLDLNLMQPNQTLSGLTSKVITSIDPYLEKYKPDIVFVQGDTTTVFAVSLVAFYKKIKIAHVEAGLRTWNKYSPFPEEINRVLTSRVADFHLAPTDTSKNNLLQEGIKENQIFVTGNTVIDALYLAKGKIENNFPKIPLLPFDVLESKRNFILITGHRRENFGKGFESICSAVSKLSEEFPDVDFIYPVHLNPNVRKPVKKYLSEKKNIYLIEPLSYLPFVALMYKAHIILTDSGGVQEEAPSFGKPVLVMRENTERPEALSAGTVKLVGTNKDKIFDEVKRLLIDENVYNLMSNAVNPYGDGLASKRIVRIIEEGL